MRCGIIDTKGQKMFNVNEEKMLKFFTEREGQGIRNDIRNLDLQAEGILDSLDMVELAMFIQNEFGKKVDLSDAKTLAALENFDSLMQLIEA